MRLVDIYLDKRYRMLPVIFGIIIFTYLAVLMILMFKYFDQQVNYQYKSLYNHEYYKKDSGNCPEGCYLRRIRDR